MPRGKLISKTTLAILGHHAEGLTVPAIAAEVGCGEMQVYNAIGKRGLGVNRIARRDYRVSLPGVSDPVQTDYLPAGEKWYAEQSYSDTRGRLLFRKSSRVWQTRERAAHAVAIGVARWTRWQAY